jgi:Rrf2 family protein
MLSISTKTQYGLIALLELTESYGRNLVQIGDIVRRRNVPKNYLEQILNRLQKSGIVRSVRGTKGGYELGAHPDDITLKQVVEALEGALELHNARLCAAFDEVLERIENSVGQLLQISLSALLVRQKMLDQQMFFSI